MTFRNKDKKSNFLKTIGALCILYYLICVAGHGFRISVLWIWLALGLFFAAWGMIPRRRFRPAKSIRVLAAAFFLYFTIFEVLVGIGACSKGCLLYTSPSPRDA